MTHNFNIKRSVAMQLTKTKLVLAMGVVLLGASSASNAAQGVYDVSITTIADLTFTQIQPISLGASVFLNAGSTCTVEGSDPSPAEVLSAGSAAMADTNGTLSGDCAGIGTAGIFEVASSDTDDAISVIIGSIDEAEWSFAPTSNCLPIYGTGAADDTCSLMIEGFANTDASTGIATPQGLTPNTLRFTVGGTMTIKGADLTPELLYSGTFPINAVYQ
jgi:hypothetical protein